MRNGLAAVIGPKAVDAALDFRDLYYEMYDHYSTALGPAKKLLALLETMEARPLDDDDLAELRGILDRMKELRARIAEQTDNADFVAQVDEHLAQQAGYEEVLDKLYRRVIPHRPLSLMPVRAPAEAQA